MRGGRDESEEALAAMGLRLEGESDDGACEVWPENWPSVLAFSALATQWRVGPDGTRYGLDYGAIPTVFDALGVSDRADVFDGLRVMELEYLERA